MMVTVYGFSPLAMLYIILFLSLSFLAGAMPILLADSRGYEPFRSQYLCCLRSAPGRLQLLLDVLATVFKLALLSAGTDATFDFSEMYLASGRIRLSTEVVWVDEFPDSRGWSVTTRDGKNGAEAVQTWDAVIVATGWYDFPVWPESTPGLAEARAAGLATHAQTWYGPGGYEGKRVVVVGNADSSNAHLKAVAAAPVYRSIRRQGLQRFAFLPDPRVIDVPRITHYIPKPSGKLDLELHGGTTLTDIDAVVHRIQRRVHALRAHSPATNAVRRARARAARLRADPPRAVQPHPLRARADTRVHRHTHVLHTFTLADVASTWLALVWTCRGTRYGHSAAS
ncbi:hypothetical protein GGX14DRAFT_616918 [Mycena pura]|uniref:FAD/NAD(P)-binding domain-containing protein n=1 Tax=Mycena pura TaxID=153505 RepID=A0AAD7E5V8_9AGAR|nr:hypothetical protein GGX14DRAFT_616918 [Mycena pura]